MCWLGFFNFSKGKVKKEERGAKLFKKRELYTYVKRIIANIQFSERRDEECLSSQFQSH
jgi:hypothetical protein